ncbi:MAG TPA: hypothetical protein ACFYD3_10040 [Candidatus Hypogeohydataceae bacterium YC41]
MGKLRQSEPRLELDGQLQGHLQVATTGKIFRLWPLIIPLVFLLTLTTEAWSDASSGWRIFSLGAQEGLSNDLFALEKLELVRPADVMVKIKVKNIGKEEASFTLSIAFFDSDKNLLTVWNYAPHFLRPRDEEYATLEIPGSGEVFPRIKYYQVSIVKRREK